MCNAVICQGACVRSAASACSRTWESRPPLKAMYKGTSAESASSRVRMCASASWVKRQGRAEVKLLLVEFSILHQPLIATLQQLVGGDGIEFSQRIVQCGLEALGGLIAVAMRPTERLGYDRVHEAELR